MTVPGVDGPVTVPWRSAAAWRVILAGAGLAVVVDTALAFAWFFALGPAAVVMLGWIPTVVGGAVVMGRAHAVGSPGWWFGTGIVAGSLVVRLVALVVGVAVYAPAV